MSTQTTNYKLVKPEAQDAVDIGVINSNMDKVDAALKTKYGTDNKPSAATLGVVPTNGDSTINGYLTMSGLSIKDAPFSSNIQFEPTLSRLEIAMSDSRDNGLAMLMLSPDSIKFMDNNGYERRIIHEGNMHQFFGAAAASLV